MAESVSFRRRNELPGVEVCTLRDAGASWVRYSSDYEFFVPVTWQGRVWHRRREGASTPGQLVCARPGEVLAARQAVAGGVARTLTIDERVRQRYRSPRDGSLANLRLRSVIRRSFELRTRVHAVFAALCANGSLAALEELLEAFLESLLSELADGSEPLLRNPFETSVAEQIRNHLLEDPSETVDLDTLARLSGLSRFQVVRVFKRRYGLPPHCYQLQRRLGFARKRLREGLRPAQVAIEYGFVDQSHLTRHFKRLFGVTPAQYARAAREPVAEVLPFAEPPAPHQDRRELMRSVANGSPSSSL